MSVNSKARTKVSFEDLLVKFNQQDVLLHALLRDRKGFSSTETKPIGTAAGSSSGSGPTGLLKTEGDTMIGPIALFPDIAIIDTEDNSINLSKALNEAYSSRVAVSTTGGGTDLDYIHGASFAGQLLDLQGILTETFNIRTVLPLAITNIVGDGATNTITVTVADTSALATGEYVKIAGTTNFNIDHIAIIVTGGTTFTYDLGSVGSATPETSGTATRGNIRTFDGSPVSVVDNDNYWIIFDSIANEWTTFVTAGGFTFPILYPEQNLGTVGSATINIDISGNTGQFKEMTLNGDIGLAFNNPPGATFLEEFWLIINQDGIGGWSITTTPTGLKNAATLDTLLDKAANAQTCFHFVTGDNGTTYHAELVDLVAAISNVPSGTANRDHLEWDGAAWIAQQNLDFDNATPGIRFRDFADTAFITVQSTTGNNLRIERDSTVGVEISANDVTDPQLFTMRQLGTAIGTMILQTTGDFMDINVGGVTTRLTVGTSILDIFLDADLNTNSINEAGRVSFSNTGGAGNALNNTIYTDPINDNFNIQSISADAIQLMQGDDILNDVHAIFTKTLADFRVQALHETRVRDLHVFGISQFDENMTLLTNGTIPQPTFSPTTDIPNPNDGGDLGTASVPWNNLNVKQIRLRDGGVIVDASSIAYDLAINANNYNVGVVGEKHRFTVFDGVSSVDTLLEVSLAELKVFQDVNLNSQNMFGAGYIDFNEIATPSNPAANVGRLYVKDDSTVTKLFFRDNAGTETDLLAGGGATDNISEGNSKVEVIDTGTGQIDIFVDDLITAKYRFNATVLNMFGRDIIGLDDLTMNGAGSLINMSGGDITNFDVIQAAVGGGSSLVMIGGTIDCSEGPILDTGDITVHQGQRILGNALAEFGIQLDNASATIGSAGMLAGPFSAADPTSDANADAIFGDHDGATGISRESAVTNAKFWAKADNGWHFEELTKAF